MVIRKKIWTEYFEKILSGEKKFELRLADFEVEKGDTLILEEYNPDKQEYTGRKIEKKVGCVMKTKNLKFWPEEEIKKYGYQIIQFGKRFLLDRQGSTGQNF